MDKIGLCFVVGLLCVCGASAQNNMTFAGGSGNMTGNFSFPYGSGSDIGSGEFSSRKILQLKFYKSALLHIGSGEFMVEIAHALGHL